MGVSLRCIFAHTALRRTLLVLSSTRTIVRQRSHAFGVWRSHSRYPKAPWFTCSLVPRVRLDGNLSLSLHSSHRADVPLATPSLSSSHAHLGQTEYSSSGVRRAASCQCASTVSDSFTARWRNHR